MQMRNELAVWNRQESKAKNRPPSAGQRSLYSAPSYHRAIIATTEPLHPSIVRKAEVSHGNTATRRRREFAIIIRALGVWRKMYCLG
jgi:hypothetical protein